MAVRPAATATGATVPAAAGFQLPIILALSTCHLLNDMMQSLLTASYPVLQQAHGLSYTQVGLITLAFQFTASLLQPLVGTVTDRRPMPYSLSAGMGSTFCGLLLLAHATTFPLILLAAAMIGIGSSVFHPEASRVARSAAGSRYGLAQSVFQVGGNSGQALGPLLAAFVVLPYGQGSVAWFSVAALVAATILARVGVWYAHRIAVKGAPRGGRAASERFLPLGRRRTQVAIAVLVVLLLSKNFYMASLGSFFTFYLITEFGVSVQTAQLFLFGYMVGIVIGVLAGGAIGDRVGRIPVIWFSILGAAPFALLLPHVGLTATLLLAMLIGVIMASAFSAILVYAQDLMPGRVGMVAGLFFGFSFGLGAVGAAALGAIADVIGIARVYQIVAFLPLLGLFTVFLPKGFGGPRG
ncbi:MAG: MFS transporter [Acetobacteraceae bacterium]|nr:MFS transporter [Acetobacteraceae bacterium]